MTELRTDLIGTTRPAADGRECGAGYWPSNFLVFWVDRPDGSNGVPDAFLPGPDSAYRVRVFSGRATLQSGLKPPRFTSLSVARKRLHPA